MVAWHNGIKISAAHFVPLNMISFGLVIVFHNTFFCGKLSPLILFLAVESLHGS